MYDSESDRDIANRNHILSYQLQPSIVGVRKTRAARLGRQMTKTIRADEGTILLCLGLGWDSEVPDSVKSFFLQTAQEAFW
jgi:hypothetical protein